MDTATLLKLAQLLQAKPNSPSTLQAAGGRAVPNFGGALSDTVRNLSTTKDINTLDQREQAEQAAAGAQNKAAIDQFTAPTTPVSGQINDVDGGAPTPLAPGHVQDMVPANRDNQDLKAAFAGPDQLGQQALLSKMLLQRSNVPYGTQQVDALGRVRANNERQPGSAGGGTTTILQIADRLKAASGGTLSDTAAIQQATVIARQNFSNATQAGVQGTTDNLTGNFKPGTTIDRVVANTGDIAAAEAGGKVEGTTETTRFYDAPKAKVAVEGLIANNNETISKAKQVSMDPALGRITGLQALFPSIWGGKAANLDASLASLKTALGFDRLQEMRQNSPTGGALGSVSDREGQWLQEALQSLAGSQSKEQFQGKLDEIVKHLERVNSQVAAAYNAEYGQAAARNGLPRATAPTPAPNAPKRVRVDAQGNVIQ